MERFKSLTRYWWAMLILGVAIFVVGILIFTYPGESYIGMAALFAVLMLVSGIIEVVIAFTEKYMVGRGWAAVLGVLEIILGIILICSPAITAMMLPIILFQPLFGIAAVVVWVGISFLVAGVSLVVFAFQLFSIKNKFKKLTE